MLSFGDLTTLLLCFFVSAISLSPLNPLIPQPQNDVSSANFEPGTSIASSQSRESLTPATRPPEFRYLDEQVLETEFDSKGPELTEAGRARVKERMKLDGYRLVAANILACSGRSAEKSEMKAWQLSSSRILGLRRQLIDVGLKPIRLSHEVLGPDCGVIATQGEPDVSGRIEAKFERITHG
jgi:hypothetical protein